MKNRLLYVLVALAFAFTTCNKDSSPVGDDEDAFDASIKGFYKLDPSSDDGYGIPFKWNSITASDFAKGKTPPFNNWEKPLGKGVYVYRTPAGDPGNINAAAKAGGGAALEDMYADKKQQFGNGNDPVWIWFDFDEINKMVWNSKIKDVNLLTSITVLVRYKASNNVAFEFNLFLSALYCKVFGPISLGCETIGKPNLGDVTQVRLEAPCKGSMNGKPNNNGCEDGYTKVGDECIKVEVNPCEVDPDDPDCAEYVDPIEPDKQTVCFKNGDDELICKTITGDDEGNCPVLTTGEYLEMLVIAEAEIDLGDADYVYLWVPSIVDYKVGDEFCETLIFTPIFGYLGTACIEGVETPTCLPLDDGIGECPTLTWAWFQENLLNKSEVVTPEGQLFTGKWYVEVNGEKVLLQEGGVEFPSCGEIKVYPLFADFTGYDYVPDSWSQDCQSNVIKADFKVKAKYHSDFTDEDYYGAEENVFVTWGGTNTNPNVWNTYPKTYKFPNSTGCGTEKFDTVLMNAVLAGSPNNSTVLCDVVISVDYQGSSKVNSISIAVQ